MRTHAILCFLAIIVVFGTERRTAIKGCGGWRLCLEHDPEKNETWTWFATWNATVQSKLEILATISRTQEPREGKKEGMLVVMSGDSTIVHQFTLLLEFVRLRDDFNPLQGDDAEVRQKYEMTFGAERGTPGSVTFLFYRVFEKCMLSPSNEDVRHAYGVYFGCGLHLLHSIPIKHPPMLKVALESWINYDTLIRERVQGFKQVNGGVKLVYMTTHPVDESLYVGEWKKMMEGYAARDPVFLDLCVERFKPILTARSLSGDELENICLDTVFGTRAVELLNRRGLSAIRGLNVSVVPAHRLVANERWATFPGDGVHYSLFAPVELFWFLTLLEDDEGVGYRA